MGGCFTEVLNQECVILQCLFSDVHRLVKVSFIFKVRGNRRNKAKGKMGNTLISKLQTFLIENFLSTPMFVIYKIEYHSFAKQKFHR